jgi:hypothetical protein
VLLAALASFAAAHAAVARPVAPIRSCTAQRWLAAWTASPSDASDAGGSLAALSGVGTLTATVDPSGHPKLPFDDAIAREIITPHWAGELIRVHLSNRFGHQPVTFEHVTVARQRVGASEVPGSPVQVTFGEHASITVPPGGEAVSDPTRFRSQAFENVAVSGSDATTQAPGRRHHGSRWTRLTNRYANTIGRHRRDA